MTDLLQKISSYNLFNYLFSGVVFVVFADNFTSYSFIQTDLLIGLFIYYFIGLVISRIGSLIIEPLLKTVSFVKFEDYSFYITASRADPLIEVISEANNMYRTIATAFITIIILKFYTILELRFPKIEDCEVYILLVVLVLIFLFAYKKQTNYLVKRIKKNTEHE
jgi:hypothetical protein